MIKWSMMGLAATSVFLMLCSVPVGAVPEDGARSAGAPTDWADFERRLESLDNEVEQLSSRASEHLAQLGPPVPTRDVARPLVGFESAFGGDGSPAGTSEADAEPLATTIRRLGAGFDDLHRWFHRREQELTSRADDVRQVTRLRVFLHAVGIRLSRVEKWMGAAAAPLDGSRAARPRNPIGAWKDTTVSRRGETASTGSVAGTVTENGSGTPIEGVMVDIYDASGDPSGSGVTGVDGTYTVSGLPAGTYYACTVNDSGYFDERYDDMRYLALCNPTAGTQIPVMSSQETGGIDFGLSKGGTLSGALTEDGTGTPIASAFVDVYGAGGSYVTSALTDASGGYSSSALVTGTYYACTSGTPVHIDETYDDIVGCVTTSGTPIGVTEPLETSGIDFGLAVGGSIAGTVEADGSGTPIETVKVEVYDSNGSLAADGTSASDGSYQVGGLVTGTYYACTFNNQGFSDETYDDMLGCVTTSGTPIGVTEPLETSGIDFGLSQGGSITGVVTEVGTGVPFGFGSMLVSVFDSNGEEVGFPSLTGPTGTYTVRGLPVGIYYARTDTAEPSQHENELYHNIPCPGLFCSPTTGTPISVTASGSVVFVDFALRWLTGCKSNLLLDGPPVDDVGLVLEGCDTVTVTGPFGVLAPGSITIRAGDAIVIGNGFFVEAGASCAFEPGSP